QEQGEKPKKLALHRLNPLRVMIPGGRDPAAHGCRPFWTALKGYVALDLPATRELRFGTESRV
ncbi:MAG: hypothetical protein VX897_03050, partial [Actinomycetota bacterium]|nr:hypothetical protein [Actinomycetota bacterium]